MKLFSTAKVGVFLDSITHRTEKRRDGEEKVIVLGCTITPFDQKLATSMDQQVRGSLFRLNGDADPQAHIAAMEFKLPIGRQDVDLFASPDTVTATRRIEQVKVSKLRAKMSGAVYTLKARLTFGPASKDELAYVELWRQTHRFLTFHESAPDLAFEEVGSTDDDDDAESESQPALGIGEEEETASVAAGKPERAQRRTISHAAGKKKKGRKR